MRATDVRLSLSPDECESNPAVSCAQALMRRDFAYTRLEMQHAKCPDRNANAPLSTAAIVERSSLSGEALAYPPAWKDDVADVFVAQEVGRV